MREKIIWIFAGILFITLAFLIPWNSQGIWPNVLSGTVAAFIFVIAFAWRWVREISSSPRRGFVYSVLAILLISLSIFTFYQYRISAMQSDILDMHRSKIDRAVARTYLHQPLLKTLRNYYRDDNNEQDMGGLFKTHYDSLINSDSVFHYPNYREGKGVKIWVSTVSEDRVMLVAEAFSADGRVSDFTNYSGEKGNYQIRGILTKEGIQYERQN